jgi:hypothetical protein
LDHETIIKPVRHWVETVVVGLNLCPFAKRELINNRVRFSVSDATTEEQLLTDLESELNLLSGDDSVETTLLINPQVLQDFYDFNQFLNYADELLVQMEFGGTEPDDVENYTNRSPYPTLHLIREASLELAIANYPDADGIPTRNIELLESLGEEKMRSLLNACFEAMEK